MRSKRSLTNQIFLFSFEFSHRRKKTSSDFWDPLPKGSRPFTSIRQLFRACQRGQTPLMERLREGNLTVDRLQLFYTGVNSRSGSDRDVLIGQFSTPPDENSICMPHQRTDQMRMSRIAGSLNHVQQKKKKFSAIPLTQLKLQKTVHRYRKENFKLFRMVRQKKYADVNGAVHTCAKKPL